MKERFYCLDGLRGLAALWVMAGHTMMLTGFALPIIVNPDLGVDLFILLSGFLMVYQYQLRAAQEDWRRQRTWLAFWLRRFFRISPLYYVLLIAGLALGGVIYHDRVIIDHFVGHPPQRPERYLDLSASNFALHFSYLFGFLPNYAFRTPLPDWSLGLEMQFYLVFPFLLLAARRMGWLLFAIAVAICGFEASHLLTAHAIFFPMPSFLPLKLHMFAAGMLIASALSSTRQRRFAHLVMVVLLATVPVGGIADFMHTTVRVVLALGFFALVHFQSIGIVDRTARLFGSKPFFWLGELSYSVYLLHLLILHPVAAALIGRLGEKLPKVAIFGGTLAIVAIVTYSLALITYSLIEKPGQALGRKVIKALVSRPASVQTPPENVAAP
jgi:peptidoglycan/LPS O-acetylase OafA/YrhL